MNGSKYRIGCLLTMVTRDTIGPKAPLDGEQIPGTQAKMENFPLQIEGVRLRTGANVNILLDQWASSAWRSVRKSRHARRFCAGWRRR
jgi:hypothetical protein